MQHRRRETASRSDRAESIPLGILARTRRAGQLSRIEPTSKPDSGEYAFLVGTLIDQPTLDCVEAEALHCGAAIHEVLLAAGHISQAGYVAALARQLGVPIVHWNCDFEATEDDDEPTTASGLATRIDGRTCCVLAATDATPGALKADVEALRRRGLEAALAPRSMIDAILAARDQRRRTDRAVNGLLREQPEGSARASAPIWQALAGVIAVGVIVGGSAVLPQATIALVTALVAVPFLCVTLLRLLALNELMARPTGMAQSGREPQQVPDQVLPVYTVLVPLLREANVLPGLVASLRALDYPPAKLEVFLILEASDSETQAALLGMALPGNFRAIVVPDCEPRTKPKALNYALQFARGAYVVVYDAEDRPQPDQLRHALQIFLRAPPRLGCLQAQLNIYNPRQSWFTRGIMAQTPLEVNPS